MYLQNETTRGRGPAVCLLLALLEISAAFPRLRTTAGCLEVLDGPQSMSVC